MTEIETAQQGVIDSQKKLIEHFEEMVKKQGELLTLADREIKTHKQIIKLYEEKCLIYEDTLNRLTNACDKLVGTIKPALSEPKSQSEPSVM